MMDNDIKPAVMAALEFYADKYNYAPDIEAVTGVNPDGTIQWDASNVETDGGKRARGAMELIKREGDKIRDSTDLMAAFRYVVDRTSPRAAMLYDDFHNSLESALIQSDNDIKEKAAAGQQKEYDRVREKHMEEREHAKNDI